MPDKLLACRTASLLALVLLLLTGCFISAEPLIPTVDIVTPLPVEFSAVQLDKNGKMVLPDQSKGPKAPDIEHLKLVSGRYVRDNGRPNILTFAKLDDSGTNFLLQVADASSGGSVVYAIARVSGQTLAIYGLAAPDGGPEGATKDDITGDYRFADYAHLKAAAQKYAQTAASGLIYRIASTPADITQMQQEAAATALSDPLHAPDCLSLAAANDFLAAHDGRALMRLDGKLLIDMGQDVRIDQADTSFRFNVVYYRWNNEVRWAITRSDVPLDQNPAKACPILNGRFYTRTVANLARDFTLRVPNQIQASPVADTMKQCAAYWPVVEKYMENRLDRFAGHTVRYPDSMAYWQLEEELGASDTPRDQVQARLDAIRQKQAADLVTERERARAQGDGRCSTPQQQIDAAGSDVKAYLVGQYWGDDMKVGVNGVVVSLLISPALNMWVMRETLRDGATVPYGNGYGVFVARDGFRFMPKQE